MLLHNTAVRNISLLHIHEECARPPAIFFYLQYNTILSPLWRISENASRILSSRFVEKVTTLLLCPIHTRAFLASVLVLVLVDIFVLSYRSPIRYFCVKCPSTCIVKRKNDNPISGVKSHTNSDIGPNLGGGGGGGGGGYPCYNDRCILSRLFWSASNFGLAGPK